MSNSKTLPAPAKPKPIDGWIRKSELDDYLDRHLPLPTQAISNEEYIPLPQTREQRTVELLTLETAQAHAKKLGMDRRQFLRSSCGMALAFAAVNSVFGNFFTVDAAELWEPGAVAEKKTSYFIFDVQTHHVAMDKQWPTADQEFIDYLVGLRRFGGSMNPELKRKTPEPSDLYIENFVKEVFLDSDTNVIALSALPSQTEEGNVLPPELLVKTRNWVNELTRSPRVISHGVFTPELGTRNLEAMELQAEKLRIEAWKGYSGVSRDRKREGWTIDDEKLVYPALEYARKLKIKNICLHKGLPFPGEQRFWQPMDVIRAAQDFPDLNFLVYHAGFKGVGDVLPAARSGFKTSSYVPWVSDMCALKQKNPKITNVYMELGSAFALMVNSSPLLCAHVLGMIIKAFGNDHLLWGTDSIWWGSPQWQIEAFRRLEMPPELMRRFGYKPLTTEVKRKIFGLNAARVYGIDPQAKRNPVPSDYVEKLRKMYQQAGGPMPSNTQYGWVRAV